MDTDSSSSASQTDVDNRTDVAHERGIGGMEQHISDMDQLFPQENCRRFATKECDDVDLLVVSKNVVNYCEYTQINEIGACLHLDESTTQEIARDFNRSPFADVVHELLMKWKANASAVSSPEAGIEQTSGDQTNAKNDTWASLMHSLASLTNCEPLLAELRDYLNQKDECKPETVGIKLSCDMTAFVSNSPVPSESSQSNDPQVSTLAKEETSPHGQDREAIDELVTGTGHDVTVGRIASNSSVNREVKKRMRETEESFADTLAFSCERLEEMKVPPSKLIVYLNQLSVHQKKNIPQFSKFMAGIISKSRHCQLFAFLSRAGAWSFLNFYLLKCLAKRYGDEEMRKKVEEYGKEVDTFMRETKLKEYLRVCSSQSSFGSLPDRKPLIVKLEEKWGDYTLVKVAEMEAYLAGEFLLELSIFHFSSGIEKCVMLMWLIPSSAINVIKKAITEKRFNFTAANICELIVGEDRFIFKPQLPKLPQIQDPLQLLVGADYTTAYKDSIENPDKFWGDLAKCLLWKKPFQKVMDCDMEKGDIRWFTGGKLNVSENCLDRHVEKNPDAIALIWEKNEPGQHEKITYRELLEMTCRIANVLKQNKIKKGDTVVIYMPVNPTAVASMLACARIGAIHSVTFSAFDAKVLQKRIKDANAKAVITANRATIGQVELHLKQNVDEAMSMPDTGVEKVFVSSSMPEATEDWHDGRDIHLEKAMADQPTECPPEPMDSEEKLFIMYTSGTSNNPKGIVHTQAGYLLYAAVTHKCVFNYKQGEVFACVADIGWITGHSYVVYGPLCNGGTSVLFDSTATYPDYDRYWEMIERLKVDHFYTTPAFIRHLLKEGKDHVLKHDLSSLKTIGSVGEPLTEAAWEWYYKVVGKEKCTLVDTWWQTELGGIAITPYPAPKGSELKPGFPMKPFFGVEPVLINKEEKQLEFTGTEQTGRLYLKKPLPGMGRDINGDSQAYKETYFKYQGLFCTYDMAKRDADGDYHIIGRVDDIKRIRGVWQIIPEIENAMNMSDPAVLDSYLVGYQDGDSKKHAAFVQLKEKISEEDKQKAIKNVGTTLSQKFTPRDPPQLIIVDKKPKTFSGKIVRHVLTELAPNVSDFHPGEVQGDTSYSASLYKVEIKDMKQSLFHLGGAYPYYEVVVH